LAQLYSETLLTLATGKGKAKFKYNDKVFERAAEWIHKKGAFTPDMLGEQLARDVIDETYRILNTAIESSISHKVPEQLTYALQNNAFIFSGFKAYHSLNEVGLSLTTGKGEIKPFNTFCEDIGKINNKYNHNWLEAEYRHAVRAAQTAAKWDRYAEDGDRYNLQYRTTGDERVRADHQAMDGITLPASDPFWNEYYVPNGWNCRCDVVQVLKDDYETTNSEEALKRGEEATAEKKEQIFRFNPGKKLKLYPDKHPYYKVSDEEAKRIIVKLVEDEAKIKMLEAEIKAIAKNTGWFERGFKQIKSVDLSQEGLNGQTDMNGIITLTTERATLCANGVEKLRAGKKLALKEADAIATLWHEITHNRSKVVPMGLSFEETIYSELANEFVARKTLPEFYAAFGRNIQHKKLMESRESSGYNNTVCCYQALIEITKCDREKVLNDVREHLFTAGYNSQEFGLTDAVFRNLNVKAKGNKAFTLREVSLMVKLCSLQKPEELAEYIKSIIH